MVVEETKSAYVVVKSLLDPTARITIPKQEIEEQLPARSSAMPEGLLDILTKAEIIDLLLYLEHSGQVTSFPWTSQPPQ
jgi:hypothetical protein